MRKALLWQVLAVLADSSKVCKKTMAKYPPGKNQSELDAWIYLSTTLPDNKMELYWDHVFFLQ